MDDFEAIRIVRWAKLCWHTTVQMIRNIFGPFGSTHTNTVRHTTQTYSDTHTNTHRVQVNFMKNSRWYSTKTYSLTPRDTGFCMTLEQCLPHRVRCWNVINQISNFLFSASSLSSWHFSQSAGAVAERLLPLDLESCVLLQLRRRRLGKGSCKR